MSERAFVGAVPPGTGGTNGQRRRGPSLFWIMAGAFLVMALVGIFAQAFLALAVLRPLEQRETRGRAELFVSRFETEIARLPQAPDETSVSALISRLREEVGLRFVSILYRDRGGMAVAEPSSRARDLLAWSEQDATTAPPPGAGQAPENRARFDLLTRRTVSRGGAPVGEIAVLRFVRTRGGAWPWPFSSRSLLLAAPVALIMSLVVALIMVRLLVRRLRAIETLARRVAEGDLSVRVEDRSGDEIGRLADRLNEMTERLAAARDHIQEHETQRRQLFADITHELATPLTSIRGYTETLLNPSVPISSEERVRYLENMLAESQRLDRLIRDLFDLARLEAGAAPLQIERLDWVALCRHTAQRFEPRFHAAGLRLVWRESEGEAWIEADGHRMEQVLENLLVNALRYVPRGGTIELAIGRVGAGAGERFRMSIADDGPGLAADEIPHLFERFYRSPAARGMDTRSEAAGSGLGLAIVREIVERHGGVVTAAPRSPQGLSIAIEMPARSQEPRAAA